MNGWKNASEPSHESGAPIVIFKADHVALILAGKKTMTRRLGKKRWLPGHVHAIRVSRYEKPRGYIRILDVSERKLSDTTDADAHAEGYSSLENYKAVWERIYKTAWDPDLLVWVVTFCIYNGTPPERRAQSTLFDGIS